jgi:hypothetical protein
MCQGEAIERVGVTGVAPLPSWAVRWRRPESLFWRRAGREAWRIDIRLM